MPSPRKNQISLDATPYYHCHTRCVRRAYLCGIDPLTGRSFEHRRQQIQDKALTLASLFYIDIAAFAVLSNHYHLVLHVRRQDALNAGAKEIVQRWHSLFAGSELSRKFLDDESLQKHERDALNADIDIWRTRLYDISWFMRVLNEGIARRANSEDECKGHFWESRFKCNALLDQKAVLSCMAYCDLNPIRAGMADTPEHSAHTSIQMRIQHWKQKTNETLDLNASCKGHENRQPESLMPFIGNEQLGNSQGIHFNLTDYLQLVECTGRQIRDDNRGHITEGHLPILDRLDISPAHWVILCTQFESRFKGVVGTWHSLKVLSARFGLKKRPNRSNSQLLYG